MTTETTTSPLLGAHRLAAEAESLAAAAVACASELTVGGTKIDDHQVACERLAVLATEARAARSLVAYAERLAPSANPDPLTEDEAFAYAAEVTQKMLGIVQAHPGDFADVPSATTILGAGPGPVGTPSRTTTPSACASCSRSLPASASTASRRSARRARSASRCAADSCGSSRSDILRMALGSDASSMTRGLCSTKLVPNV